MNVEKHLALENGTPDPSCCFKIIINNVIKTICMDSDVYKDQCQYYKMRTVLTIKNLCLQFMSGFTHSGGTSSSNSANAGGFNPLSPSASGG